MTVPGWNPLACPFTKGGLTGMRHALVIGGSGMLAGASLWLARAGHQVSVIGRNPQKLKRLCDQHPNLHGVSADYSRAAAFSAQSPGGRMRRLSMPVKALTEAAATGWLRSCLVPERCRFSIGPDDRRDVPAVCGCSRARYGAARCSCSFSSFPTDGE